MAGQRITKRIVDSLKIEVSEYSVWDATMPGFGVRVRPTGAMSYVVVYRAGSGRGAPYRRYTIGAIGKITPEKARTRAKSILGAVAHGKDPAADKTTERATPTVAELSDRFISEHVEPKRKPKNTAFYRDVLDRIVKPDLGTTKADKLTRAAVAKLHGTLKATPFQANRVLAVVASMYGFAARAGILPEGTAMKGRKLPDTTLSRAIVIEMKRKKPHELAADFDHVDDEDFARLRRQCLRWANDAATPLTLARPEIPPGFHNRVRANWKPLLAIAELAGDDWKEKTWEAAEALSGVTPTGSVGVRLLADIKGVFAGGDLDEVLSRVLVEKLTADLESPWHEWKGGKPLTQKQLANLLREFTIISVDVRPGVIHGKGYKRAQFEDAWSRYLDPPPLKAASEACKRASVDSTCPSADFSSVREDVPHGSRNDDLSNRHDGLHACTDERDKFQ
jgi:Protein of unknown function (DUF3631)/Arm DNA-binding domain